MCFPLRCLKCIVGFSAWVTILLGVASFVFGIVLSVRTSGDSDNYYKALGDVQGSKNGLVVCLYIFGACLVGIGLFGVIGGKKKNACCLAIFNLGAVLGFIAFLVVGAIAYGLTATFANTSVSDCKTLNWSFPIYQLSSSAQTSFCKDSGCQCYINPTSFPDNYLTQNNITFTTPDQTVKFLQINQLQAPTQFQSCSQYTELPTNAQQQNILMSSAEKQFKCAGWCSPSPIYLFTDVNNGQPDLSCYDDVSDWLHSNGMIIGDIAMTIAGLSFLSVLFTCCLCFHPEKKNASGNFYQRMAYYDE